MRIHLRVEKSTGEPIVVTTNAWDIVQFENTFDRSVTKFETEVKYGDLLWLAWRALTRQGVETAEFDEWLKDVDSVEADEKDPK